MSDRDLLLNDRGEIPAWMTRREILDYISAHDAEIARLRAALDTAADAIDELRMPRAKAAARAALGEAPR